MQAFNLQAFNKKRLQQRRFPVKFAKFLRTLFFTKHLRWLLLANGAPYLVKLQVTLFIKKNWTSFTRDFYHNLKKNFIPEKPFGKHIFAEYFSMAAYWKFENYASLFKRKKASTISGNTFFHWEIWKHETEGMLTWVRNKLTVCLLLI